MSDDDERVPKPFKGDPNFFTLQERDCIGCEAKIEHIRAIKDALEEVFEENEALRTRVVELEAWVNKAADKMEKREEQIMDLYQSIGDLSQK
jgi:enamine deaminase RidA (YjgF/YER057c/UK114 family)